MTFMHVFANCMEFPPTPQNPSTITSPLQRSAKCSAIFSGVTEYQDSSDSILIPSSYLEKRRYRWCQYFLDSAYGKSAVVRMSVVFISLSCFTDEVSDIDLSQLLLSTSSRVDSSKSAPSVMVLKMSLTVPLSALLVPYFSFLVPLLLRRLVLIMLPSSSYLYLLFMFSLLVLLTISLEAKYTDADWISLVSGWRSFRPGSKVNPRSVKALPAFDLFRA